MQSRQKKLSATPSPRPGCSPQQPAALLLLSRFLRPRSPFPTSSWASAVIPRLGSWLHVLGTREEEEEEEEGRKFVFNDTVEGPRAPAVKPGRITQA